MDDADFEALGEDDHYYAEIGRNIWLMDNHKWAMYIWDQFRKQSEIPRFSLVHADFHWDNGNDACGSRENERRVLTADDAGLRAILEEENLIRYDSFIAPAVLRGGIAEVHFFCKQGDQYDVGLDADLLGRMGTRQFIHETVEALIGQEFAAPIIYDLCLDLFNKAHKMMYEADLWADEEILGFLDLCRPLIERAKLVTVSLSFGYSGSEPDTRRLAKLVVPKVMGWR